MTLPLVTDIGCPPRERSSWGSRERIRHLALATLTALIISTEGAHSSSAAPPTTLATKDSIEQTDAGSRFTAPAGWVLARASGKVTLTAPEPDLIARIVEVGRANDAKAALAAAWTAQDAGVDHTIRLAAPQPPQDGWDERWSFDYLTSPSERLVIQAMALRKADRWTVLIFKGSEASADKRQAAIRLLLQSLKPKGYTDESFAGRKPHSMDPERIAAVRAFVRESMQELGIPGVGLAVVDHGHIVLEDGLGVRELGKRAPVDARTLFMVGSNTKGMTTLLLSELVDQHKLEWDEPVVQADIAFRFGDAEVTRKVEIRHLVCACTGLPRQDLEMVFKPTAKTPPSEVFSMLARMQPTSGFGETFQYSNMLAAAAGYVAAHALEPEKEAGTAYDQAMQRMIFDPLSMRDTTFSMTRALSANHASPHGDAIDGSVQVASIDPDKFVIFVRPGGGAWSSAHDMIRYVNNELMLGVLPNGARLVSAENLLVRRRPGVSMGEGRSYGMGLRNDSVSGVHVIHHGGSTAGYKSDFYVVPDAGVGAVLLTNSDSGAALLGPFQRRLLELLYDGEPQAAAMVRTAAAAARADLAEQRRRLEIPAEATAIANLATRYENPALGEIEIRRSTRGSIFRFAGWSSPVASRHNSDGTVSLVTIDPVMNGFEFQIAQRAGRTSLVTRDPQREYVYTPTP